MKISDKLIKRIEYQFQIPIKYIQRIYPGYSDKERGTWSWFALSLDGSICVGSVCTMSECAKSDSWIITEEFNNNFDIYPINKNEELQ